MKNKLSVVLVCLLSMGAVGCSNNKNNATSESTAAEENVQEAVVEKPVTQKLQEAKTMEEVKQLLNGTTWHYTENLDKSEIGCWIKVEFNGDNYTTYYALPSEGHWTQDRTGVYSLKEGRYTNTGERYISVNWDGNIKNPQLGITIPCDMAFTTDDFGLRVHSSQMDAVLYDGNGMIKQIILKGTMENGDYQWN